MVAAICCAWEGRLDPDMPANAILAACSPLPSVHLSLPPLHAPLSLLLILLPFPIVCIAAAVAHDALPMLQIVLPPSCASAVCYVLSCGRSRAIVLQPFVLQHMQRCSDFEMLKL